jgi:ribosomal protein S18 acetylase RimI-like enzyme
MMDFRVPTALSADLALECRASAVAFDERAILRATLEVVADIVVRRVTPDDGALIRHVRLKALASDPASFGSTYEREAAYANEEWAEWAAGDASGDDMATLLAVSRDEPVGIVAASRDESERNIFNVFSMWVAPERRGEGIGRRLLTEIEAWIVSSGGTAVRLSVTDVAAAARRLYESAGYEVDGRSTESRHTPGLIEIGLRKQLSG